jgi:hypothetical protein
MYALVFVLYFIPDKKVSSNQDPNNKESTSQQTSMSVFKLIWNLIRFIIIMSISVPLGGFFCLFYFTFYSLFAMLYYSNWDLWKLAATYKDMLMFIDNKKIPITGKPNPSFFETLILKFNEYVEYISDNFLIITLLITFIYGTTDVVNNVKNTTLRSVLLYLFVSFIFIVVMFLIYIIKLWN